MLELRSLTLAYSDRPLFSGLDYDVKAGELVGITGESGTGKTSLLRAIVGVIPITAGTIEVCGLPLDVHHIHAIRQKIAYVPQELQPPAEDGAALIALTHALAFNRALLASQPTSPAGRLTPQPSTLNSLNSSPPSPSTPHCFRWRPRSSPAASANASSLPQPSRCPSPCCCSMSPLQRSTRRTASA